MKPNRLIELLKNIPKEIKEELEDLYKKEEEEIKEKKRRNQFNKKRSFNNFIKKLKKIDNKVNLNNYEVYIYTIMDRKMTLLYGYLLISIPKQIPYINNYLSIHFIIEDRLSTVYMDGLEIEILYKEEYKNIEKNFIEKNLLHFPISLQKYIQTKIKERKNNFEIKKITNLFEYQFFLSSLPENPTKQKLKNHITRTKIKKDKKEMIITLFYSLKAYEEKYNEELIKEIKEYILKNIYKEVFSISESIVKLNTYKKEILKEIKELCNQAYFKGLLVKILKLNSSNNIHFLLFLDREKIDVSFELKKYFIKKVKLPYMKYEELPQNLQEELIEEYKKKYYLENSNI